MPLDSTVAKYNIAVVEPDPGIRESFGIGIEFRGHNPILFNTPQECLESLKKLPDNQYPNLYFVDMGGLDDPKHPLKEIYNYLEQIGKNKNFYFMTTDLSSKGELVNQKDKEVIESTEAPFFNKTRFNKKLDEILKEVSK